MNATRATALLTAIVATVAMAAAPAPAAAAATAPPDMARVARTAVHDARARQLSVGIAVLDVHTGALATAGAADRRYPTASVAKTLIATMLLLRHRCHGRNAALAWKMITASDNDAAYALYDQVGGDRLLPTLARHYRIRGLGRAPTQRGRWGSTQVTARGLAHFYAAIRRDRTVWPWLGRAMHHWHARSSAGEPNDFGIAAAAPRSAVKNGWVTGRDPARPGAAVINTTGFVDGDRYAVVVLGEGPGSLYARPGERIVTHVARVLLPHGHVAPFALPVVRRLDVSHGSVRGGERITLTGTGLSRVTAVWFGTTRARAFGGASGTGLRVLTPRHVAGVVPLRVVTTYGTSAARRFAFRADAPSP